MPLKTILDRVADAIKGSPEKMNIPLFTLGAVLFPEGRMSLRVFETRYMDMVKASLKTRTPFGMVLIHEGSEVGKAAVPEDVGTLATIDDWDMAQLGVLQIRVRGSQRFRVLSQQPNAAGLVMAEVELLPDDAHYDNVEVRACASFLRKVFDKHPDVLHEQARYEDASWVSFRLTEILPFSNSIKQKMLALTDAKLRVEILHRFLMEQRLLDP